MKPLHLDQHIRQPRNIIVLGIFILTVGILGGIFTHNHTTGAKDDPLTVLSPLSKNSNDAVSHMEVFKGDVATRDRLINLFIPNDPNSIFTVVDTIQADPNLTRNCHEIAHELGKRAYTMYGFSDAMTFNNPKHVSHALVQFICAGGYLHGILAALSVEQPGFMDDPGATCMLLEEETRASCFHGIGHVLMIAEERNAPQAISDCRKVHETTDMYRCFEGVRMEQFWGNAGHTSSSSLGWNIEKPLEPCIDAMEDAKPTCFLYSSFGYLRANPKDYHGAVEMCVSSKISESDTRFCLKGLGITMMSKFKGKNLEGSEIYVSELPQEERLAFYQGVLGYAHLSGVSRDELEISCTLFKNDAALCKEVLFDIKE